MKKIFFYIFWTKLSILIIKIFILFIKLFIMIQKMKKIPFNSQEHAFFFSQKKYQFLRVNIHFKDLKNNP